MESGRREEGRGRRVASEDAGKDEKLPLSSGGVGRRRRHLRRRPHPWHCLLLFSFPSRASLSSFLRRKWPLDVTVIILRASLARKNEQESELERAEERSGGGGGNKNARGREREKRREWVGCATAAKREREKETGPIW